MIDKEKLKWAIYNLDWITIMAEAIKNRPTSWKNDPIHEWRNASDEVCSAVINALKEKKIID